jgi:hypothetical protein
MEEDLLFAMYEYLVLKDDDGAVMKKAELILTGITTVASWRATMLIGRYIS